MHQEIHRAGGGPLPARPVRATSQGAQRARPVRAALSVAAALAVCLAGPPAAPAATQRHGLVSLTPLPVNPEQTWHGYVEYRVVVRNESPKRSQAVHLWMPAERYGSSPLSRVSRSVEVAPESTVVVSLLQPPLLMRGDGLGARVGQGEPFKLSMTVPQHGPQTGDDAKRAVLVSRSVGPLPWLGAAEEWKGVRAELPVADWSHNWLAYTRYDGVVVSGDDLERVPSPVRLALTRYVETGGTLLVQGGLDPSVAFAPAEGIARSGGRRDVLFGQCLVTGESDAAMGTHDFRQSVEATFSTWETMPTPMQAHTRFPVVETLGVPVLGMLVLMLVFVILIGPVNLLVLWRKRRRILLFVTAPAISLVTCGLVFGYAVFSEGFRGRYRTASLTVLDERANRATSIGWTAFYSPLAAGGGLHFSPATELTPQLGAPSGGYYYGSRSSSVEGSRTVSWTEDQHLVSDWVRARIPLHLRCRKSESRRERLTLRPSADGPPAVVNGLGAPVRTLVLADADGRVYRAETIDPGAEAALAPTTLTPQGTTLRGVYRSDWLQGLRQMEQEPQTYLRPGTYVAVLEENPFVETGLRGAVGGNCRTLVYGICGGDDDGRPR